MSPVFKPSCFLTGAGTVSWPFDDILDSKWAILLSLHLREFPHRNEFVRRSQAPHDLPAKAVNLPLARKGDERDLPGLPRLEADRGAGRDVEAHAAGFLALERERRIGLEEMIMRADLDRPVAGIGDRKLHARPAGIERDVAVLRDDLAILGDDFAGDHGRCRSLGNPLPMWERVASEASRVRGGLLLLNSVKEPLTRLGPAVLGTLSRKGRGKKGSADRVV